MHSTSTTYSSGYLDKAEQVFLTPMPQYSWTQIVLGADVRSQFSGTRRLSAVGQNTFRGFHKVNKLLSGAKEAFTRYFLEQEPALTHSLSSVASRDDLDLLSNRICDEVSAGLGNCLPSQRRSFNKIRKPVDLYLEHLVAMAVELAERRSRLVPLLNLPLDSQILAHPDLFSVHELTAHGLTRRSTYKDIHNQETYASLQRLLLTKANSVAESLGRSFHVIYFDLLWNDPFGSVDGMQLLSERS